MIIKLFRTIFILILCSVCMPIWAQADSTAVEKVNYVPEVHFTLRGAYEWNTVTGQSRFMVRHARASVTGQVLTWAGYHVQVDLCDRGKFKILDVFMRLTPAERLKIIIGQSTLPFSLSGARAPRNYYFSNRSFPGKYYGTTRSAGIKAAYTLSGIPLYLEGGVFNSTTMEDHQGWNSHFTYSVRAQLQPCVPLLGHIGFQSRVPAEGSGGTRLNMLDTGLLLNCGRWTFEGEYMMVHCTGAFPTSHLWEVLAVYRIPLHTRMFNRLSLESRYDGHTALTNGARDETGTILVTHPRSSRLTVGSTISSIKGPVHFDFRLNYEQYFHDRAETPSPENDSKLVATVCLYY